MQISEMTVGTVMLHRSAQFGAVNHCVVTRNPKSNRAYAIYCNPDNPSEKRLPDDREFCIWDFAAHEFGLVRKGA